MSADDLAKGIAALEDDDVRSKVAEGDLSAFGGLDLTDEELDLLQGAANDYPEVVGFDIRAGLLNLNIGQKLVGPGMAAQQDITVNKAKTADKAYTQMDNYIKQ